MGKDSWELYFEVVKKQDWEAAKDILNKIALKEKANPQVHLKLGDVYQRAGDTAKAIASYHLSAKILKFQGFNQKALALYKIILRLDPKNSEAIERSEELMGEAESRRGSVLPSPSYPPSPEPAAGEAEELPPSIDLAPLQGTMEVEPPQPAQQEEKPAGASWMDDLANLSPGSGDITHRTSFVEEPQGDETVPESFIESTSYAEEPVKVSSGLSLDDFRIDGEPDMPLPDTKARGDEDTFARSPEDDMTSVTEMLSSMPEEEFNRMMNELIVPVSERRGTSTVPDLFAGMSEEEYRDVLSGLEVRKYPDKGVVIEEGDSGDSIYIVKSGNARVVAHLLGREVELAQLRDGDVFGEVGFLTGRPRTASVIAAGPLEVMEISRVNIEGLIERNPEILSRIEDFHETRVKETVRKIVGEQRKK